MITKAVTVSVKTNPEADDGIVEALAATYDRDSVGDKIVPGAFEKTLKEWSDAGRKIPFVWSHKHADLDAYVGTVLDAKETADGLWVKAQMGMDDPKAAKAYRLMKDGRINNLSFAYKVEEGAFVKSDENGADQSYYELRQLKLYEVGPCLVGANQNTRVLGVKRDEFIPDTETKEDSLTNVTEQLGTLIKAGSRHSASDLKAMQEAHDILSGLGVDCGDTSKSDDVEDKTSTDGEVKDLIPSEAARLQIELRKRNSE